MEDWKVSVTAIYDSRQENGGLEGFSNMDTGRNIEERAINTVEWDRDWKLDCRSAM